MPCRFPTTLVIFLFFLGNPGSSPAKAASSVIFDAFGPGDAYNFLSAYAINPPGLGYVIANSFSVSNGNFTLDSIQLAVAGFYPMDIALMADASGLPDSVLETFHISSMSFPYSTNNPLLTLSSVLHPVLASGKNYWLRVGLSPASSSLQSWWNIRTTAPSGNAASQFPFINAGAWTLNGAGSGAFRITGTRVALNTSPATLNFSYLPSGNIPPPLDLLISSSTPGAAVLATATSEGGWLSINAASGVTPFAIIASVNPSGLAAGTYVGGIVISGGANDSAPTNVPVTLNIRAPAVTLTASSASNTGPFTSGQLITVYGSQLGPAAGTLAHVDNGRVATNSGGVRVLFDGIPAPILYAGPTQINTAIPCLLAGKSSTQMVVEFLGIQSPPVILGLVSSAPSIFTIDGIGKGQGAILNEDFSVNSALNPAMRGSIIQVFGTGVGATSPVCSDGKIYDSNLPIPSAQVLGGIGTGGVQVTYAGQAPDSVSGLAQFNITIPVDAPVGAVNLSVKVGDNYSQPNVTVAIK